MNDAICDNNWDFRKVFAVCVGLGLAFQVGHFAEHAIQFAVWVSGTYQWVATTFCGRDTPYMSPPLTRMVQIAGALLFPGSSPARQMMLGMELLHLMGNAIFLATIAGVYYFCPSKWVRYAFCLEGGHMCEHLALTATALFVGKPIGISTVFGQAVYWLGQEGAVGYRVTWHFAMNLFPMPFVMIGMMRHDWARPPALAAAA
ncbi:MAG TPA: DUF6008 family protein [Stellaceae bacterium]|nr:DUF6008 family protein [Stellaceae bacterium]